MSKDETMAMPDEVEGNLETILKPYKEYSEKVEPENNDDGNDKSSNDDAGLDDVNYDINHGHDIYGDNDYDGGFYDRNNHDLLYSKNNVGDNLREQGIRDFKEEL